MRCTPMRYTPICEVNPMRYMSLRDIPIRHMLLRYTPIRGYVYEVSACKMYVAEVYASEYVRCGV